MNRIEIMTRRDRRDDCLPGDFVTSARVPEWKHATASQEFRPE
jgi:hypothetical protein